MENFDWTGWTDWSPLASLDLKKVPAGPGAYIISTNRPITRAIGIDPFGMLDVGESDGLRQRLTDFLRCARKRGDEGHMAGWRFAFFRFERHFPWDSLRVRWAAASSKKDAYKLEGRTLLAYITLHCELPPLNYKFNWNDMAAMEVFFNALSGNTC